MDQLTCNLFLLNLLPFGYDYIRAQLAEDHVWRRWNDDFNCPVCALSNNENDQQRQEAQRHRELIAHQFQCLQMVKAKVK